MKKHMLCGIACFLVIFFSSFMKNSSAGEAVAFPEGYLQWNHIKTHLTGLNNPAAPNTAASIIFMPTI